MAIKVPSTVRQAWGEEAATDFTDWFETILRERVVSRDEHREILSRLDILEHDVGELRSEMNRRFERVDEHFDRVDKRFDRVDERFERMDERFERMSTRMEERFDQVDAHFDRMNARMGEHLDKMYERMTSLIRWTVGTLALFGSLITILEIISRFAR